MALQWTATAENIQQQISQIDFVLANPNTPASRAFLEVMPIEQLRVRRAVYVKLLPMSPKRRAAVMALVDAKTNF